MEDEFIVRQAEEQDIPQIIRFIKENWSENHIFVKSMDFFRYMLCDKHGVNVIIAVDSKNKIYGMEGCTFYNSSETPDSSGMMWRCLKTSDVMLAVKIDKYMKTWQNQKFHFGVGANPDTTLKIAKKFYKNYVGKMDHFYRLNSCVKEFHIAKVVHKDIPLCVDKNIILQKIGSAEQLKEILPDSVLRQYTPYKDIDYLIRRYVEHPIYQYDLYLMKKEHGESRSVLITRKLEIDNRIAIKIIDFIGNNQDLDGVGEELDRLMRRENAEWIDIYSFGIGENELNNAGFIRLEDGDENIIPNYFEPFLQQNVDIYYTTSQIEGVKLFRGDADQDRPNFISERKQHDNI